MNTTLRLLAAASVLAVLSAPAWSEERQTTQPAEDQQKSEVPPSEAAPAEPAPAPAQSMQQLLTAGYEVKALSVVPHDVVKRGGSTTDIDAMIFVLQKGTQLATCYVGFSALFDRSLLGLPCTEQGTP